MSDNEAVNNVSPSDTPTESVSGFASDRVLLAQLKESVSVPQSSQDGIPQAPPVPEVHSSPQPTPQPEVPTPQSAEAKTEVDKLNPSDGTVEANSGESESDDPLSFNLPDSGEVSEASVGTEVSDSETVATRVTYDPASPLKEEDPQWMHEAYQRLKEDPELDEEVKAAIKGLPAERWDSARTWNKSHKKLGQFRNPEYPMEQFLESLEKQSPERTSDLKMTVIRDVIGDSEALVNFANHNPETYSYLMVALADSQPELLAKVLERKGYSVSSSPTLTDFDSISEELENSEEWDYIVGTELEDKIKALFAQTAQMTEKLRQQEELSLFPESENKEGDAEDYIPPQVRKAAEITNSVFSRWEADVKDGVESAGIKYPSDAEVQSAPIPSLLRRLAYNISVHGLEGTLPPWQEAIFTWGERVEGFKSKTTELTDLINQAREEEASSYARSLAPHAHRFGKLRAGIPAVKTLLRLAEAEEKRIAEGHPSVSVATRRADTSHSPASSETPQSNGSGFLSDRLILGR